MNKLNYLWSMILVWMTACYPAPKVSGQFTQQEFDQMADQMANGKTPDISIDNFIRNKSEFVILDTREKKEYDISHIPDALWVGYDDFDIKRVSADKNKKIVVYCSVGYRSERIGEQLLDAGYTEVYNLNGSIFRWINSGYQLVNSDGQKTTKIHGYNKKWSKWIKDGEIVY